MDDAVFWYVKDAKHWHPEDAAFHESLSEAGEIRLNLLHLQNRQFITELFIKEIQNGFKMRDNRDS